MGYEKPSEAASAREPVQSADAIEEIPSQGKQEPNEAGNQDAEAITYLKGLRLGCIFTALCVCMFLTNLEIPIVTTALVGITNDLQGFDQSSWVISAYLLGYVGVLIIFSKLSDIFGRKLFLLVAVFIFVIFSAACGAAQTVTQLIVFRAFQGVGGAGNYALCSVMLLELVPPEKYAALTSFVSVIYSLSLLLGPIFGGAINQSSTWRWVFLLNIPPGVLAGIVIVICVPNNFPYHDRPRNQNRKITAIFSRATLGRVDFLGAGMLLVATLFFVAALEEAGFNFPWRSAFVITLLTISGILWIIFLIWERKVSLAATVQEPIFPWRLVKNRVWAGMLLNALFLGGPWFVAVFQLPQRFQIVNGASPLRAGIQLMPFTFAAPLGSMASAIVASKMQVPPIYLVIFASVLQIIGFALLSTLPASSELIPAQYGYEVIAGFGCGINISLLMLMAPFSVTDQDKAVAMGSIAQFRVLGGAVGLAVVTTVLNNFVRPRLVEFSSEGSITALLQSAEAIGSFAPDTQLLIKSTFAEGYNLQMKILAGFAAAQVPSSILMWQKKQIMV